MTFDERETVESMTFHERENVGMQLDSQTYTQCYTCVGVVTAPQCTFPCVCQCSQQ